MSKVFEDVEGALMSTIMDKVDETWKTFEYKFIVRAKKEGDGILMDELGLFITDIKEDDNGDKLKQDAVN